MVQPAASIICQIVIPIWPNPNKTKRSDSMSEKSIDEMSVAEVMRQVYATTTDAKITDLDLMRVSLRRVGIEFKEHQSDFLNAVVIDIDRGTVGSHVMIAFGKYTGSLLDIAAI
jgi:hypothetical protein